MQRLAGRARCAIANRLHPAPGGLGAFRPALLSAAASALGVTDQALKSDLAKGMSLSRVAAAQNVTEADFRSRLIAKLTPVLDAAVTNKQITAAQEQEILNRLQSGQIPFWTRPVHAGAAGTPTPTG
jgi:hypothetical protein